VQVQVIEVGDVSFFYRPRAGVEEVRGLDDVQRFFFVLEPDRKRHFRRFAVGARRLPDPLSDERLWAFVSQVAEGDGAPPAASPVGEGRYGIIDHEGHTHLAYVLERPEEPGDAQRVLKIEREASYVIAVRNPDAPAPPGVGLPPHQRARLPQELLERFRDRRFIAVEAPELIDHERVEVVLIGASADIDGELGIAFDPEDEGFEDADVEWLTKGDLG
jgi:hypothetical protein